MIRRKTVRNCCDACECYSKPLEWLRSYLKDTDRGRHYVSLRTANESFLEVSVRSQPDICITTAGRGEVIWEAPVRLSVPFDG